ncbi:radical SAM protein [Vulcanisaeta thermophila]|uniref:radical SAM protein n=1 Tax=Vulcanisaeta thermophila TaxID=867917 RepID=UPI001EE3248C|nr:radical SAM protein [Vulcanisaeta thermophila]
MDPVGRCLICGRDGIITNSIGACVNCLRERPADALAIVRRFRAKWRLSVGLPIAPPREGDYHCHVCVNECSIPRGSRGFCGVWVNDGKLRPLGGQGRLVLMTYLDPLPTNCVATPVCPAVGRGYPRFSRYKHGEYGLFNLAVFMGGCDLDCLFCQNYEHKIWIAGGKVRGRLRSVGVEELVKEALNPEVPCICYFGGDPTPHTPMLIMASRRILTESERLGQGVKRICWETNGLVNPVIMREMARLSLVSGGIVKIDWKAWTPSVYEALTGVDGEKALERLKVNTRIVAEMARERDEPPLLVVSILLVPGYIDEHEVSGIANYVAGLMREFSVNIPIVLLAFHPDHLMRDLPPTSLRHMMSAVDVVKSAGIREVYVGNEWLLGDYY